MSLHDEYARRTPFEIAFPDRSVAESLSGEVAEEIVARGVDDSVLEAFITTTAAGERVREMRGPDAPPDTAYPFAALLYHCVHFLRAGAPLYLVATEVARQLLGPEWQARSSAASVPAPEPPAAAGYLQLPQHLIWTEGGRSEAPDGAPPESLDGVFWTLTASRVLNVLPVSGLLPSRPGFAALPLPPAPLADASIWLEARVRPSGEDFASALPGGELDRLYSVRTAGEVLKLLARFFSLVKAAMGGEGHAVRLEARRPSAEPAGEPTGAPPSSALPYTRLSLEG
jgi:hypothetical protein